MPPGGLPEAERQEDELCYDFSQPVNKNIKLKATYKAAAPKNVTVNFSLAEANSWYQTRLSIPSQTILSGGYATEPSVDWCVECRDYAYGDNAFLGWYNGSTKWNFATMPVTQNMTLTAKFSGISTQYAHCCSVPEPD